MQSNVIADKALGYGQFAAGAIDASTLLSTIVLNGVAGVPDGTARILIRPEVQAVRWRDDGTAPTTAVGHPLAVGETLEYVARNAKSLRFIASTAGAVLNATFYGAGS